MAMSDDAGAMADALQIMLARIFARELPEELAGGACAATVSPQKRDIVANVSR